MPSGRKFALVLGTSVQHDELVLHVTFNGVDKEDIAYRDVVSGDWVSLGDHTEASTTASRLLCHAVTLPEHVDDEWGGVDWEDDHPLRTIGEDSDAYPGTIHDMIIIWHCFYMI